MRSRMSRCSSSMKMTRTVTSAGRAERRHQAREPRGEPEVDVRLVGDHDRCPACGLTVGARRCLSSMSFLMSRASTGPSRRRRPGSHCERRRLSAGCSGDSPAGPPPGWTLARRVPSRAASCAPIVSRDHEHDGRASPHPALQSALTQGFSRNVSSSATATGSRTGSAQSSSDDDQHAAAERDPGPKPRHAAAICKASAVQPIGRAQSAARN